ncbi:uncharacterized protein LOC144388777 [Gasterosteus aculeatus]
MRIQELEFQVVSLELEIQQLTVKQQQQPLIFKFCVTDEDFRYYTKFSSKEVFTVFWESVYPSASGLLYWSKAQQTAQETPSPQRKLPLIDELFMFLCRVAAGLQEKTLSTIFEVSLSTVSRIILTWTSYLYQVLGSLPLWMTREQVQATMPDKFKLYCPQVRVIIDCTEIRCETASSLLLQSETFSNYKTHTTFKGLIGIAPCGVITFVSKLYTGSISDIEITQQSQILQLLQPEDGVMADKGFQIEKMLSQVGATLIIPPLKKSNQLTTADTLKTQAIARLRILVERAIRRVMEYHIWDGLVPLSMVVSVNQLWAICCLLSNYQGCAVYLDDVVVYSEEWSEHLDRIRALFSRLVDARLTVNLAKCEFAQATVAYLGKIVGQGQVKPVHAKVVAIDKFPVPANKTELRRFLGMPYNLHIRHIRGVDNVMADALSRAPGGLE